MVWRFIPISYEQEKLNKIELEKKNMCSNDSPMVYSKLM